MVAAHFHFSVAELSPDELRAIRAYSLKKGLEKFRLAFISELGLDLSGDIAILYARLSSGIETNRYTLETRARLEG